ncbi:HlyD family efflux transporter periplasmic adaptor subunit [Temperatibacter marinus]|uniref:HlyD family efflux transporter periplasmic adaptor subunit n=1 Tax=Temperatibacter marinus TaxID=1456591 RepID=A0AA52EFW6_9PROT|nr:HlyD family efflux transporter periplasmic adaptor subunit [Temperatibacter marinus]WND02938.1 HlyD family efflux transporter periplasmic adaptor subunit [Temperatibacter marinus]
MQKKSENILASLVVIEQEARAADSIEALGFVITNRTFEVSPYSLGMLWLNDPMKGVRLASASGVVNIEENTPFLQFMTAVHDYILTIKEDLLTGTSFGLERESLPETLQERAKEWLSPNILLLPLCDRDGLCLGILTLTRDKDWRDHERALLDLLIQSYGHCLWAFQQRKVSQKMTLKKLLQSKKVVTACVAFFIILLFPFRQSVVVSAEVGAINPTAITATADVPIGEIKVFPNQVVKKNDILFILDEARHTSRYNVLVKTLEVTKADLLRVRQQGFFDERSRAEIKSLEAKILQHEAEIDHVEQILTDLTVRAPHDGVVLFPSPQDLLGKPVVVGEQVMLLSNPNKVELIAWLPAADAITLKKGADLSLTLHISPLNSYQARLATAAYQAEISPDGIAAYRLKADFVGKSEAEQQLQPRLGLKGSARLYGDRMPLLYQAMRRPLYWVRQKLAL